jgi:hypothetical protein
MTDANTRFVRVHDGDHVVQCHLEARGEGKESAEFLVVQDARGGAATWLHPDTDAGEISRLADAHPEVEGLFGAPTAVQGDIRWYHPDVDEHPGDHGQRGDQG